jgi:hypothetical protein
MGMSMLPVFAYLDPGASSLLLQAFVGGFAGLLVFARHFYRVFRYGRAPQPHTDGNQVCN